MTNLPPRATSEVEPLSSLETVTAERDLLIAQAHRREQTVGTLARELGHFAVEQDRTGREVAWLAEALSDFARRASDRLSPNDADRLRGIRARADEIAARLAPREGGATALARELAEARSEIARLRMDQRPALAWDCVDDDDGEAG